MQEMLMGSSSSKNRIACFLMSPDWLKLAALVTLKKEAVFNTEEDALATAAVAG